MRPVPTWKSTAAAPAPTRLGATLLPWASSPWQLAQETANRSLPSVICDDDEPEPADALLPLPMPVSAAYRLPTATSAIRTAAKPKIRGRRRAVIQLTSALGFPNCCPLDSSSLQVRPDARRAVNWVTPSASGSVDQIDGG